MTTYRNKMLRIPSWFPLYLVLAGTAYAGPGGREGLVELRTVVPGSFVELRYATPNNFTGKTVYECGRCFLRRRTAEKVARAQDFLAQKGYALKLWDCYRPLAVQKTFWALVPDLRYVADPRTGSSHNRGTAVDVTLVDAAGKEQQMPTDFDDFSPRASQRETSLPQTALRNRELLTDAMRRAGFEPLATEWWHFEDREGAGELLDLPFKDLCR